MKKRLQYNLKSLSRSSSTTPLLYNSNVKILKNRTRKNCCSYPKIGTVWFYDRVRCPKDADGMSNSLDPDQTAPVGAVWSGSTLFVWKLYYYTSMYALTLYVFDTFNFKTLIHYERTEGCQILSNQWKISRLDVCTRRFSCNRPRPKDDLEVENIHNASLISRQASHFTAINIFSSFVFCPDTNICINI